MSLVDMLKMFEFFSVHVRLFVVFLLLVTNAAWIVIALINSVV